MEDGVLRNADCVVHLSDFVDSYLAELKAQCRPDARQILWTGHAHDRAAVAGLAQSEIQSLIARFRHGQRVAGRLLLPGCPAWPDAWREHAVDIRVGAR